MTAPSTLYSIHFPSLAASIPVCGALTLQPRWLLFHNNLNPSTARLAGHTTIILPYYCFRKCLKGLECAAPPPSLSTIQSSHAFGPSSLNTYRGI